MKKIILSLLAIFASLGFYSGETGSGDVQEVLSNFESGEIFATCGGGSHGSDHDPVGGKRQG